MRMTLGSTPLTGIGVCRRYAGELIPCGWVDNLFDDYTPVSLDNQRPASVGSKTVQYHQIQRWAVRWRYEASSV